MKVKKGILNIWLILAAAAVLVVGIVVYAKVGTPDETYQMETTDRSINLIPPVVGVSDKASILDEELAATSFAEIDSELADVESNLNNSQ